MAGCGLAGDDGVVSEVVVAFYRNMNLGHVGSPDRVGLEGALRDAGARVARSFQTNGTVVLEVGAQDPQVVVARAAPVLERSAGYVDAVFVRPLAQLSAILARGPFRGATDEVTYRCTFTFFEPGAPFGAALPWTSARGDVDIVEVDAGIALGVIRKRGATAGSPTGELEKRLGTAATTRTAGTIERLVRALT